MLSSKISNHNSLSSLATLISWTISFITNKLRHRILIIRWVTSKRNKHHQTTTCLAGICSSNNRCLISTCSSNISTNRIRWQPSSQTLLQLIIIASSHNSSNNKTKHFSNKCSKMLLQQLLHNNNRCSQQDNSKLTSHNKDKLPWCLSNNNLLLDYNNKFQEMEVNSNKVWLHQRSRWAWTRATHTATSQCPLSFLTS